MTLLFTILAFFASWLFFGLGDFLGEITTHDIANIAAIVLTIAVASSAAKIRLILEEIQDIVKMYSSFTHPDSESGGKLSKTEKAKLLDHFLSRLKSMCMTFEGSIFAKIGRIVLKFVQLIGLRR